MAENDGRRVVNGLVGEKRGSRFVTRDCNKATDQDILLCNRIGCSGRLSSARSTRNLSFDKSKILKPSSSMCSSSAKVMTANPLNKTVKGTNFVKPLRGLRTNSPSVSASSSDAQDTDAVTVDLTESQSSERSNVRPTRTFLKKPASITGSNFTLTSSRISGVTKSATQLSRPNVSTTRPGSRYLRCGSVSAVAASDSTSNSRKQILKKRSSEEEESNSSLRAKQPTIAKTTRTPGSRNGVSISEVRQARRSQTSLMDDVNAMVRARRSDNSTSRRPTQLSRRASATDQHTQRLPYSLSATGGTHRVHSHNPPIATEDSQSRNLASTSEVTSSTSLIDHEGFRHYNINGIAEVLLALDQIEHDQEISFEQLIALESNLFLNGLNFHDQHRDMRLDIDGMSYEELLALEERMGSVSTALSEEALAKSIKKSPYNPKSLNTSSPTKNESEDDPKCSICQEEYDVGDETGSLKCKHKYHVDCINQWLRQKNWCPICKSSAASSSSSS